MKDHWKGWNDYWEGEEPSGTISFILDDDTSIRYKVPRKDFVNGTFLDSEGNLKWVEKEYYKRSRKSPIGYVLIHERKGM